jgi:hypothetical protein
MMTDSAKKLPFCHETVTSARYRFRQQTQGVTHMTTQPQEQPKETAQEKRSEDHVQTPPDGKTGMLAMVSSFADKIRGEKATVTEKAAPLPAEFRPQDASLGEREVSRMAQQFLQNFEYVELFYPVSGIVRDSAPLPGHHPHIIFRMCGDDRKALTADQRSALLARQIDRGTALLERSGVELEDWYVDQSRGELQFDARVPDLPEGVSEEQFLRDLTGKLQEACTAARAARQESGRAA